MPILLFFLGAAAGAGVWAWLSKKTYMIIVLLAIFGFFYFLKTRGKT